LIFGSGYLGQRWSGDLWSRRPWTSATELRWEKVFGRRGFDTYGIRWQLDSWLRRNCPPRGASKRAVERGDTAEGVHGGRRAM